MLSLSLLLGLVGFASAQVASLDAVTASTDLFEGLQCGNFTTLDDSLFGCISSAVAGPCTGVIPVGCGVPLIAADQDIIDSEFPWVSTRTTGPTAGIANLGTTLDPTATNSHLNIGEFATGLSGGYVGFIRPNSDLATKVAGVIDSRTNYVFTTNYCTSNETTTGRLRMNVYVTSEDATAIGAFGNAPAGPSGTTLPTISGDPTMPNLAVGDGYSDVVTLVDSTPNATCGTLEVRFRHYELFSHVGIEGFGIKLSTAPTAGGGSFEGTVFVETSVTTETFQAETGVDACTGVFLSEIDYLVLDEPQPGNVTSQAFEIVGPSGTDLAGYRIRSVASDGTVVFDETIGFSLVIPEAPASGNSPGFGHQVFTVSGGLPDFGTDAHAIELYDGTTLLDTVCYGPEGAAAPTGVTCNFITTVNGTALEDMTGSMSLQRYGCGGCPADFDWELALESHAASTNVMPDATAEGSENDNMYLCFDDGDGYWGGAQFFEFAGQVNSVPTYSCQCGGNDCQDTFGTIFPGAGEQCDGYLTNCTAVLDFGAADINSATGAQVDDARAATADGVGGDEADNDGDGRIDCDGDCRDGSGLVPDADGADSYGAASVVCDNVFYEDAADFPTADCGANEEVCDGVDNDCDGSFFADLVLHCPDLDNDGYGNCTVDATGNQNGRLIPDCIVSPDGSLVNRTFPAFYAPSNDDCDDTADTINPGFAGFDYCTDAMLEDGIDNDCDGLVDEDPDPQFDEDGDGFYDLAGNCTSATPGSASIIEDNMFDCNDTNPNVFPEAPEICDGFANNCTAVNLGETYDRLDDDFDMDTYIECDADIDAVADGLFNDMAGFNLTALDCNDTDATINPAAFDHVHFMPGGFMVGGVAIGVGCDGIDNNCNGLIDEEFYGNDEDGDGFYDMPHPLDGCPTSDELIGRLPRDCDDTDATIRPPTELVPGFVELCDGKINNCSAVALPLDEQDTDGDFYVECEPVEDNDFAALIAGFLGGGDCNDTRADVNPGEADTIHIGLGGCDGVDNNCNGFIDEEFLGKDVDGDGFYDNPHPKLGCPTSDEPIGLLARDCDDTDDTVFPGATQLCDGKQNDCTVNDFAGTFIMVPTDELDNDSDGYVECETYVGSNVAINGGGDCDDTDNTISPGLLDDSLTCDGVDNNCNGQVDEEVGLDADGDGFLGANFPGGCSTSSNVMGQRDQDCNDGDNLIFPGAPEICDGVKNDCDANSRDGAERDMDGDGFYGCLPVRTQYLPGGIDHTRLDCDDTDDEINPLATDNCDDGKDNDCDGFADNVFVDSDGDGFPRATCATSDHPVASNVADCDDNNEFVFPDAEEVCDGRVNTCGGTLPDDEADEDNDGYMICTAVEGAVKLGGDCNDEDAAIKPGVTDPCDGVDNNCNGIIDENFTDADFDGAPLEDNCVGPDGLVRAQDCDDADPLQSPAFSDRDEQFQTAENGFTDGLDHDCNPNNVVDAPNLELDVDTELENRKRSVLHKKHHHHHSSTSGSTSSSSSSYRGRRDEDSGANSDQTVVDVFVRITNNGGGNAENVVVKGQIVLPAGASFISRVFGTDDFSVRIDEDGDFIWLQNEVAAGSVAEITVRVLVNQAADEGDIRAVSRIERVEGFTPNVVAVL